MGIFERTQSAKPTRGLLRSLMVGLLLASGGVLGVGSTAAHALGSDLVGPPGSEAFGDSIVVLSNGNYVITDPLFDSATAADVGAVYLYNGLTNSVISTLTGSTAGDKVGSDEVAELSNGNYVVVSTHWHAGAAVDAGAATWGSGVTGMNGVVSAANSLVGSSTGDAIGLNGVRALTNGNYVVTSQHWSAGAVIDAGAVTWGSGVSGVVGVVSAANSLVGSTMNDQVGFSGVRALPNGSYVVLSPFWNSGAVVSAGAVTWSSGVSGVVGVVSASNSLVGSAALDKVGSSGLKVLPFGNYVVPSPLWNSGAVADAGAVTWGSSVSGVAGVVSAANSLIGSTTADKIGSGGVTGLSNGNYVVASPLWDAGAVTNVGAVTLSNGASGTVGVVSAANSLIGGTANDQVGSGGVTALSNGNYVVSSPLRDGFGIIDLGAVTWSSGVVGKVGFVLSTNSLIGSTVGDKIGVGGVTALPNGNYVVASPLWDSGAVVDAGAFTWGNGASGLVGVVSVANSQVGSSNGDQVGNRAVNALSNGNYVVSTRTWDGGGVVDVGAVAWGNGASGSAGVISAANSLVGSTVGDKVGEVWTLPNGNYVVLSENWDAGAVVDVGAVTWGNGLSGTKGVVSAANSLIGSTALDQVGSGEIYLAANSDYFVATSTWDAGGVVDVGAITKGSGVAATVGVVSAANSLVGSTAGDQVGYYGVYVLSNDNAVVASPYWDGAGVADVGAVTFIGAGGLVGAVSGANSLVGSTDGDRVGFKGVTVLPNGAYAVTSSNWDSGGLVDAGAVTYGPAGGVVGAVSVANSVIGTPPGIVYGPAGDPSVLTSGKVLLIGTAQNRVLLLSAGPLPTTTKPVELVSLTPARLADTRVGGTTADESFAGGGRRDAGSTLTLPVAGRGGVVGDAVAVVLNVTVVDPVDAGFVTVYPCGQPLPTASNVNFAAGATVPNAVVAKTGAGGTVCVFVSAATNLIVDVNGYFPTSTTLTSLNPARLMDTRPGSGTIDGQGAVGLRAAGSITEVQLTGRVGVAGDASSAALNVTVTGATEAGFVTVFPCGQALPTASNVNYTSGATIANLVIAKIGANGRVCVYTSAATNLIADLTGYFPAVSGYSSLNPARLLDTRPGSGTIDGQDAGVGLRAKGTITQLTVTGRGGVPVAATTVVLNVTVTAAANAGFITVYPCGAPLPVASNLNYAVGATVANAVVAKIGTSGQVCLFNSGATQLITDTNGYTTD